MLPYLAGRRVYKLPEVITTTIIINNYTPQMSVIKGTLHQNSRSHNTNTKAWYTAISRKAVGKKVHGKIRSSNMGYDEYTIPDDCSCQTYFCCFPLVHTNIRPWPLVPFFQISLKNSELKTTHSTFRDCRVHFLRQHFSKLLYSGYVPYMPEGYSVPTQKAIRYHSMKTYSIWDSPL